MAVFLFIVNSVYYTNKLG